jgi:hypothetical protein
MTKFKEKLEIDLLKAMTYTEINNLLNKLNKQIDYLQKKVNQGQTLPIDSVVESLPKRFSNRAYGNAKTMRYEDFVKWWDEQV